KCESNDSVIVWSGCIVVHNYHLSFHHIVHSL
ncbi:hypothetical protein SNEBB_004947, partial [Seison nebaliae]